MEHRANVVATVKVARVITDQHLPYLPPPPPRAPLLPDLPIFFFVLMTYETQLCIAYSSSSSYKALQPI